MPGNARLSSSVRPPRLAPCRHIFREQWRRDALPALPSLVSLSNAVKPSAASASTTATSTGSSTTTSSTASSVNHSFRATSLPLPRSLIGRRRVRPQLEREVTRSSTLAVAVGGDCCRDTWETAHLIVRPSSTEVNARSDVRGPERKSIAAANRCELKSLHDNTLQRSNSSDAFSGRYAPPSGSSSLTPVAPNDPSPTFSCFGSSRRRPSARQALCSSTSSKASVAAPCKNKNQMGPGQALPPRNSRNASFISSYNSVIQKSSHFAHGEQAREKAKQLASSVEAGPPLGRSSSFPQEHAAAPRIRPAPPPVLMRGRAPSILGGRQKAYESRHDSRAVKAASRNASIDHGAAIGKGGAVGRRLAEKAGRNPNKAQASVRSLLPQFGSASGECRFKICCSTADVTSANVSRETSGFPTSKNKVHNDCSVPRDREGSTSIAGKAPYLKSSGPHLAVQEGSSRMKSSAEITCPENLSNNSRKLVALPSITKSTDTIVKNELETFDRDVSKSSSCEESIISSKPVVSENAHEQSAPLTIVGQDALPARPLSEKETPLDQGARALIKTADACARCPSTSVPLPILLTAQGDGKTHFRLGSRKRAYQWQSSSDREEIFGQGASGPNNGLVTSSSAGVHPVKATDTTVAGESVCFEQFAMKPSARPNSVPSKRELEPLCYDSLLNVLDPFTTTKPRSDPSFSVFTSPIRPCSAPLQSNPETRGTEAMILNEPTTWLGETLSHMDTERYTVKGHQAQPHKTPISQITTPYYQSVLQPLSSSSSSSSSSSATASSSSSAAGSNLSQAVTHRHGRRRCTRQRPRKRIDSHTDIAPWMAAVDAAVAARSRLVYPGGSPYNTGHVFSAATTVISTIQTANTTGGPRPVAHESPVTALGVARECLGNLAIQALCHSVQCRPAGMVAQRGSVMSEVLHNGHGRRERTHPHDRRTIAGDRASSSLVEYCEELLVRKGKTEREVKEALLTGSPRAVSNRGKSQSSHTTTPMGWNSSGESCRHSVESENARQLVIKSSRETWGPTANASRASEMWRTTCQTLSGSTGRRGFETNAGTPLPQTPSALSSYTPTPFVAPPNPFVESNAPSSSATALLAPLQPSTVSAQPSALLVQGTAGSRRTSAGRTPVMIGAFGFHTEAAGRSKGCKSISSILRSSTKTDSTVFSRYTPSAGGRQLRRQTPMRGSLTPYSGCKGPSRRLSDCYATPPAPLRRSNLGTSLLLSGLRMRCPATVKEAIFSHQADPNAYLTISTANLPWMILAPHLHSLSSTSSVRPSNGYKEATGNIAAPKNGETVAHKVSLTGAVPAALLHGEMQIILSRLPATVRLHPLHLAAVSSSPAVVKVLIRCGACPNALDSFNRNALQTLLQPPFWLLNTPSDYTTDTDSPAMLSKVSEASVGHFQHWQTFFAQQAVDRAWWESNTASILIDAQIDIARRDIWGSSAVDYAKEWLRLSRVAAKHEALPGSSFSRLKGEALRAKVPYDVIDVTLLQEDRLRLKALAPLVGIDVGIPVQNHLDVACPRPTLCVGLSPTTSVLQSQFLEKSVVCITNGRDICQGVKHGEERGVVCESINHSADVTTNSQGGLPSVPSPAEYEGRRNSNSTDDASLLPVICARSSQSISPSQSATQSQARLIDVRRRSQNSGPSSGGGEGSTPKLTGGIDRVGGGWKPPYSHCAEVLGSSSSHEDICRPRLQGVLLTEEPLPPGGNALQQAPTNSLIATSNGGCAPSALASDCLKVIQTSRPDSSTSLKQGKQRKRHKGPVGIPNDEFVQFLRLASSSSKRLHPALSTIWEFLGARLYPQEAPIANTHKEPSDGLRQSNLQPPLQSFWSREALYAHQMPQRTVVGLSEVLDEEFSA